ncbi:MAG: type II secretion system major pseudopilin GspG [Deltaproteobacteria bacterium]|nr:type II secretion system major pseudopilin GspG [Deltaproteobacteria bacterium]
MSKQVLRGLAQSERGMTLIEIMVVVAILGMMMTIVTVAYVRYLDQSKVDGTKIQMANVVQALDAYKVQYGNYPTTEEGLQQIVAKGVMKNLPKDKWDREFEYSRNSSTSYSLKSLGADGTPGGEGFDEDLVSEQ